MWVGFRRPMGQVTFIILMGSWEFSEAQKSSGPKPLPRYAALSGVPRYLLPSVLWCSVFSPLPR